LSKHSAVVWVLGHDQCADRSDADCSGAFDDEQPVPTR
jgi:hypothetical protein